MKLVTAKSVEVSKPNWLWQGRIPCGAISILEGDPGVSKSTLLLDLAARISAGRPMPQCTDTQEAGNVLLLQLESHEGRIKQLLEAADADLNRVMMIGAEHGDTDELMLPQLVDQIRASFKSEQPPRLIVLDPLDDFVLGSTANRLVVKTALHPLRQLAQEWDSAVILVRHWTKSTRDNPIHKGAGSIGVSGVVRSVLAVCPEDPELDTRLLVQIKSNFGPLAATQRFKLEPMDEAVQVSWLGESAVTAASMSRSKERDRAALKDACEFLTRLLKDGAVPATDVSTEREAAGISEKTLRRAKDELGVQSVRIGFGRGSEVLWKLPDPPRPADETEDIPAAPVPAEREKDPAIAAIVPTKPVRSPATRTASTQLTGKKRKPVLSDACARISGGLA